MPFWPKWVRMWFFSIDPASTFPFAFGAPETEMNNVNRRIEVRNFDGGRAGAPYNAFPRTQSCRTCPDTLRKAEAVALASALATPAEYTPDWVDHAATPRFVQKRILTDPQ